VASSLYEERSSGASRSAGNVGNGKKGRWREKGRDRGSRGIGGAEKVRSKGARSRHHSDGRSGKKMCVVSCVVDRRRKLLDGQKKPPE